LISNGTPVFFEIASKSSTTDFNSGIPSGALIACASLRISGDQRACGARGGFGFAKDADPFIDLIFISSLSMKRGSARPPNRCPMRFPGY
jgi:hypothetical protein